MPAWPTVFRATRRALSSCCLALSLIAPTAPSRAAEFTAYIGFMAPRSGANKERGESMINGAQLAVDELNRRKPRIGGHRVSFELLVQDDRYDANTGKFVAQFLVKRKVIAALCHSSTVCIASAGVFRDANIALISVGATNPQFTRLGGAQTFRMFGHSEQGGAVFGQYVAHELKLARIAVIDDRTPSGQAMADAFSEAFTKAGGEIAERHSVSDKTSDFNAALASVRASCVDAVFWGGTYLQVAGMVARARGMGMRLTFLNAMNGMNNPYVLQQIGGDAGRLYTLESDQPRARMPGWKAFEKAYLARFPDSFIDVSALRAYDAVLMTGAAAAAANSLESGVLVEAMHREKIRGLTGPIAFDRDGNLLNPVFSVYQSDGMEWRTLKAPLIK